MPSIEEVDLLQLQIQMNEVKRRSNRIFEWLRLQATLGIFERDFKRFKRSSDIIEIADFADVRDDYHACRIGGAIALEVFRNNMGYLNEPLSVQGNDHVPIPRLNDLLTRFGDLQPHIQNQSLVLLRDHAQALEISLETTKMDYRTILDREVEELCSLTALLVREFALQPA